MKKPIRELSPFLNLGFHGDKYLLAVVDELAGKSECFIETGANVGSTLAYVAKGYPHLQCVSCEPDGPAFEEARKNISGLDNVLLYNELSQDFIGRIEKEMPELFDRNAMFWLDAHGYGFDWPLKEELAFITGKFRKGFILIDDFKVPGLDRFEYDVYKDQVCSFDFVKGSLNAKHEYEVFYPNYTEKTSPHHPLTGWGLIVFGHSGFSFSSDIASKVRRSNGDRGLAEDWGDMRPSVQASEDPDMVRPFRITAAGRVKAGYEKMRYPSTDFRHYRALWDGVNGWLTFEQARWLFEKAKDSVPAGDIVEIGSAYGRSTVCLGAGVKLSKNGKIFSVDPHIGGKGFREQLKDRDSYSSLDGFRENLKRFEIESEVEAIVKTSEDALKSWNGKGIRLLFIDGWHTYDAVTHDILGWEKYVVKGGLIVLHDYQDEGVRRAIHDCMKKLGVSEKELKFVNGEMVFFVKQGR